MFVGTSLAAAMQWLTEWNQGREKLMSDLHHTVMDPLVDFHNKLEHIAKVWSHF